MKALVIPRFGGPDVLELQNLPDAHPGPDQVLIKVEAGGLNFADLMTTQGGYAGTPKPPLVAIYTDWRLCSFPSPGWRRCCSLPTEFI